MEKLNVLQTLYSGLGGHGNVVFSLLSTDFLTDYKSTLVFYGIEPALPFYINRAEQLGVSHFSIQKKPKRYFKSFTAFRKILHESSPDCIIIHDSELIIPANTYRKKNKKCRLIYIEHESNQSKRRFLWWMSRFAYKKADKVVCLSSSYKNELIERLSVKNEDKFVVIPNGIDISVFKPKHAPLTDTLTIGMAARFSTLRDHLLLVKAFARLVEKYPKAVLKLAGTGDSLRAVKDAVNNHSLSANVEFLGFLDEAEMVDFYGSLHLYVHATKSENLSTSILQAMAMELPVITADLSNNKPLIQHEKTGWLYSTGDEADLTKKLHLALENKQNWTNMTKAARQTVLTLYSNEVMVKKYSNLINKKEQ